MSPVVVIGAGLAGLAAACHLTGAGYEVTVVERGSGPGGRNGLLERDGFSFDTGPTVLTMPDLIADALRAAGSDLSLLGPIKKLDPAYRACYADGSTIMVRHTREAMRQEIADTCGSVDAAAFEGFVEWLRKLYLAEMPHFIDANFDSPLDLVRNPVAAAQLLRLGGFRKLGNAVRSFFTDPRLIKLFTFQALYAGLAPEKALALYAVITYMDSVEGVYFPEAGMNVVPHALATAAEKNGAQLLYDSSVESVLRSPTGRVAGVRLTGGETVRADAVVCTLDTPTAYASLLPELTPPRAARPGKGDYSPSAVVWHVGVRGMPQAEAKHHNIHFGTAWDSSFEALIEGGTLMPDPSRMVTMHSMDAPGLAPDGCSTLYVLEPVPNLATGRIDWVQEAPRMRDRLHAFLGREGYPDDVVVEELVTPLDWQAQGMAAGTPFALAHTFAQTGPFRPPNVERRVPGMFFAGSGTVPGVGVPMVLISGKLAARRVADYLPLTSR
ncbi:MAG TPA: phytoene desaturase family protein [Friedmanniella sp.]